MPYSTSNSEITHKLLAFCINPLDNYLFIPILKKRFKNLPALQISCKGVA